VAVAASCVGIASEAQHEQLPVTVNLERGHHVVATEALHDTHTFSLSARPGQYSLVLPMDASSLLPVHVTLRTGRVVHVNLVPSCA
jgi:hypothetical protein